MRTILILLVLFGCASLIFLGSPLHGHGQVATGQRRAALPHRSRSRPQPRRQKEEEKEAEADEDDEDVEEGEDDDSEGEGAAPAGASASSGAQVDAMEEGPLVTTTLSAMSLDERLAKGKLYFLFMLQDSLPHADVWKTFFSGAPSGSYQAFAHCTKPASCRKMGVFADLGIELVSTVPSKWCVDLVSPAFHLIRTALRSEDPGREGEGGGGPRKFVLVSDSTLPIQPLARMRQALLKTDHSDICISPKNEWASVSIFGTTYSVVKHHQWAVLGRQDAEAFVQGWERLSKYDTFIKNGVHDLSPGQYEWEVPRMGGNGRANLSATVPRKMIVSPGRCPDEEVFTTLIFGLHEQSREKFWRDIQSRSACRTYVNWSCKNPPEVFGRVTDKLHELSQDASDSAYLFARKFKRDAPLKDLKALIAPKRNKQG